ncbi:MAG: prepilin-type N-terminal cleavage/methylation domain-containing protein [Bacilli bacterium]|nr:prepilin-type N-terminal cleavage/methylation domain-containing protein [Bacilli bacterium]
MKKEKGFTLVEILAVIVILGIIILIATTVIIPHINSAKKKAFLDEALVYISAAENYYAMDNDSEESTKVCIPISSLNGTYVKKNSASYDGTIVLEPQNENVKHTISMTNGKYYIYGTGELTKDNVYDEMPSGYLSSCDNMSDSTEYTYDNPNTLAYKLIMAEGESSFDANITKINLRTAGVNFSKVEKTAANSGLYMAEDDYGTSYYYRGKLTNNFVSFAGAYWRIIRINGDGSIRLLYSGLLSSNHSGDNTFMPTTTSSTKRHIVNDNYVEMYTPDVSQFTTNNIKSSFKNRSQLTNFSGYMYNSKFSINAFPNMDVSATNTVNKFPLYTEAISYSDYYLFKNFDENVDCSVGNDNDPTGGCTLKCRELGNDCIKVRWSEFTSAGGYYSTTAPGVYPANNPTEYVYTSEYKYACMLKDLAKGVTTRKNSDNTTSVYSSCALPFEIVGVIKDEPGKLRVKLRGIIEADPNKAYGNAHNSVLKDEVDIWYQNNIYSKKDANNHSLEEYLSDEIFCSDRELASDSKDYLSSSTTAMHYAAYERVNSATPSLKCTNKQRDAFTLKTQNVTSLVTPSDIGNKTLTYPVGLITVDEYIMSGMKYNTGNSDGHLAANYLWTMTPSMYDFGTMNQFMYVMDLGSKIFDKSTQTTGYNMRPVINLKPDILYDSGDGSDTNPYIVKLN